MPTQRNTKRLEFEGFGRGRVLAAFDDGPITSDAGALLLRQVEQRLSLFDQVADFFSDHRNPDRIQHSLHTLIAQRVPWAMRTSTTTANSVTMRSWP